MNVIRICVPYADVNISAHRSSWMPCHHYAYISRSISVSTTYMQHTMYNVLYCYDFVFQTRGKYSYYLLTLCDWLFGYVYIFFSLYYRVSDVVSFVSCIWFKQTNKKLLFETFFFFLCSFPSHNFIISRLSVQCGYGMRCARDIFMANKQKIALKSHTLHDSQFRAVFY